MKTTRWLSNDELKKFFKKNPFIKIDNIDYKVGKTIKDKKIKITYTLLYL